MLVVLYSFVFINISQAAGGDDQYFGSEMNEWSYLVWVKCYVIILF